jgi:hypothetical protein
MDTYRKLYEAASCRNLLKYSDLLVDFAKSALQEKNRKALVDLFYDQAYQLLKSRLLNNLFEPKDYEIISGGHAANCYSALALPIKTSPVKTLKRLVEYGEASRGTFKRPSKTALDKNQLAEILAYMDAEHSIFENVFGGKTPLFLLLDYSHAVYNNELLLLEAGSGIPFCFLICNLRKDAVNEISPEAVFFHELGHAVHVNYAGSPDVFPKEVLAFLKQNGFFMIESVPHEDVKEIIADILSIGMMFDTPYESLISPTFQKIDQNHKRAYRIMATEMIKKKGDHLST